MVCLVVLLLPLASQVTLFFVVRNLFQVWFMFLCVRLVKYLKLFSMFHVVSCCFVSVYVVESCLGCLGCWNCCSSCFVVFGCLFQVTLVLDFYSKLPQVHLNR